VNWFRKDADGRFMWPGYGDNMRVLKWITERCAGAAQAVSTPVGMMPSPADLDLTGLNLSSQSLDALLAIDPAVWAREMDDIEGFFADFGPRLPPALRQQVERIREQIGPQQAA